jgi:hypothetical protein
MASVTTFNELFARMSADYIRKEPAYHYTGAATTATPFGAAGSSGQFVANLKPVPTLETGVTAYIPVRYEAVASLVNTGTILGKLVDLGALTLGNGAGGASSFADGNAMPTVTECGVSRQVASCVFGVVETAITATPGTFTITYVDQDGNAAETTAAITPTASSLVGSMGIIQPLNGTDWGVRDITAAARTGGTNPGGVVRFYGILPLTNAYMQLANAGVSKDFVVTNPNILRLAAGDDLGLFTYGGNAPTSARTVVGEVTYVGDS